MKRLAFLLAGLAGSCSLSPAYAATTGKVGQQPVKTNAGVALSMSKTGEAFASFLYTASNTGTAIYVRGTRQVSITLTQTGGSLGTTVFLDWSNNSTAPNVNDPTAWTTTTPNGIVMHSGLLSNCSVCGSVPGNIINAPTAAIWLKVRIESLGPSVSSITGYVLGTQ